MRAITQRRTLFQTEDGLIGIGPPGTKLGDEVCIIMGYPIPLYFGKLRTIMFFWGGCFVLDLMRSEYVTEILKSPQEFEIH
jgi:hypothetical protein